MASTKTSEARSHLSAATGPLRSNNKPQGALEVHYSKWNRFENFLKFASKKEVRDRLKELEPPPVEHYIDPDVVAKIR